MAHQQTAPLGWVLFDGSCGVCRTLARHSAGVLRRRGFAVAPLQQDWVRERLGAPSDDDLLFDLRLLLADGRQVRGADAYRYVLARIWWTYPLYLLSRAPLLRNLFDWSYRAFADNRYRLSRSCGLQARE